MADQSSVQLLEIPQSSATNAGTTLTPESIQSTHESDGNSQSSPLVLLGPAPPPPWYPPEGDSQNGRRTDTSTHTPPSYPLIGRQLRYKSNQQFWHRDSLGRKWKGRRDDRFLNATDGRLLPLVVQSTNKVRREAGEVTWARTILIDDTPAILKVMFWALGSRVTKDAESSTPFHVEVTSSTPLIRNNQARAQLKTWFNYPVGAVIIFVLLFFPADLDGEPRHNGQYEPFKYHYWGYAPISSNPYECPTLLGSPDSAPEQRDPASERLLRPRVLCFLRETHSIDIFKVSDWEKEHGDTKTLQYIFVAYTTTQFSHDEESDDMEVLHSIAETAARRAGVQAYWLACSCMPDDKHLADDLYCISDVVRGAHSLVIALGPPVEGRGSRIYTTRELLKEWGRRMWTFPEVLLSPNTHPISIYTRGASEEEPWQIRKRNFPAEAWVDASNSRELVDHYEGSIILSPLELVTIAFQCLSTRPLKEKSEADIAYVLMGLLRRRPRVDFDNSAFQAFSRLSMSNDSDQLLERLICLHPKSTKEKWYVVDDIWDRNLWDVDPFCQVVGVCSGDSVVLSGAFGASIRWKSFKSVSLTHRNTVGRFISKFALRAAPLWLIASVSLLAVSPKYRTENEDGSFSATSASQACQVAGFSFMGITIILVALSPLMIYSLYAGKTWSAQPWLFGFEGYLPIHEIEALVLGVNMNRLTWTPYSSQLSRHCMVDGECIGRDPTEDLEVKNIVNFSAYARYEEPKVFTLVDTFTMKVTLFQAVRPPVALLLCGSEGGMHRGLLCSYDWPTQTLTRETVLRVDTRTLDKMARVGRVRIGLEKISPDTSPMYTFVNNDANPA
ncbi:uncharacterized protein N7446_010870 [Penicillium canescens]|uniref:3-hydroxyisobutyrate dehydrogenase protein n=1 Tax=Penicillium canescens TaxID=5083 RepID=A0AAD6N7X2_PENCN|nr:uncharacterized protein N7446_010870 [Penicillium canescens]KAJ6041237.1 hypothetical protein N7460_006627 [Penicillium canescens]KAJ6050761.1 hypothetical protein N7446_010870 [Penicillium canescens]KAJ6065973.1 hypothetical protein N7444_001626 [Penicillium canescens]